jgi:hypothetical protein
MKEIRSWAISGVSLLTSPLVDLEGAFGETAWHWKWVSEVYQKSDQTLTIQAENEKTHERRTLKLLWDRDWEKQVDHFAKFPMQKLGLAIAGIDEAFERALSQPMTEGELFFLKASKNSGKASIASTALLQSLIFEVLSRRDELLKTSDPAFLQYLVFEARNSSLRVNELLKGGPSSIIPFVEGNNPLSWRKILKWELAQDQSHRDSIEEISYKGVEGLLFTQKQLPDDAPLFEFFLAQLYFKLKTRFFDSRMVDTQAPFAYSLGVLQSDNRSSKHAQFQFVDGRALRLRRDSGEEIAPQFKNFPEQMRQFIQNRYTQELNLTPIQLSELMRISQEMEDRTRYLALTQETYAKLDPKVRQVLHPVMNFMFRIRELRETDFDAFTILGGMSIVESRGYHEPVPLELFTEVKIKRKTKKPIVEIGRFSVERGLRPLGPKQIWQACTVIAATQDLEKIVAETHEEYALELIEKYGFKKVLERKNFEGKTEYILEVTPEELFARSFIKD